MDHHRWGFLTLLIAVLSWFAGAAVVQVAGQNYTPYEPYCSTTRNYTVGSQYQVNLFKLLSELPSSAIANGGFHDAVVGEAPDSVFGLAMCYADLNSTACANCLRAGAASAQQTCPFGREMKTFYDEACFLRYSDEPFASVADIDIAFYGLDNVSFVADMAGFNATRWELMTRLTAEASVSSLLLANGSQGYRDSQGADQVLFGFAQCTRDLNASECNRCLANYLSDISVTLPNYTYGSAMGYSCYMGCSVGEEISLTIYYYRNGFFGAGILAFPGAGVPPAPSFRY